MNASRDPDRMIHAFLLEGAERLQDQVYDAVRADIDVKRQRAFVGPWRLPTMNKLVPIGLGAAAVVGVIVLGSRLLDAPVPTLGPGAGASPTPVPTAAAPSVVAPTTTAGGSLPLGPFLVTDAARPADTPSITVTIPAPGWTSIPAYGGLQKGSLGDPPQSAMLLWAFPVGTDFDVYGDPCQWKSTRPDTSATTVDEIAAALAAQATRDASDPVDVALVGPDGYLGKKITLHVPSDAAFEDCDDGTFASYGVAGASSPNRTHQGAGQVDELWIVNVNQAIVIIDVMYRADTPAALIDEMRTIAESAEFGW